MQCILHVVIDQRLTALERQMRTDNLGLLIDETLSDELKVADAHHQQSKNRAFSSFINKVINLDALETQ